MRDTIDMAREAGIRDCTCSGSMGCLKAFEALVRADQDEKYKWDVHSCGPTCKRYACVAMREAVEAEREACAKVCDEIKAKIWKYHTYEVKQTAKNVCINLAAAIRARGNT